MENSSVTVTSKDKTEMKKVKMTPVRIAGMLFCLVAAGAFGIEDMLPLSGPGLTITMLIVFAIIWAHPISQIVSELSAFMPEEGGIYVWTREAMGEFWGFCTGWWGALCTFLGSSAYIVLITDYASKFLPPLQDPIIRFIVQLIIVMIFLYINIRGLGDVAWVNTAFSIAILVAFAAVTVVGFCHWQYNPIEPFTPEGQSIVDSLGGSICIVIWMYCGYECVSSTAGEIANPEVIPKGFRLVMPIIALSYILPTVAGMVSVGHWEEWATDGLGYGDILSQCIGYGWGVGFLVIAILSQMAIFNAYVASGSRAFFVLADDHLSPKLLAKCSKKTGLPVASMAVMCLITIIMMNFDFTTLMIILGPLALIVYVTLALALLLLRKKYPIEERSGAYYIKGGKAKIYAYCIAPMVITVIGLLVNGTEYFLLGFISIGTAVLFYIMFKIIYGGLAKDDPESYPINPKTRLAKGDITRIGIYVLAFGLYALVGSFFLQWYEGSWGPEYYLDLYGSGIISNFWLMIKTARIGGAIATIVAIILIAVGKKTDPPARGLFERAPNDHWVEDAAQRAAERALEE